jgi:hypothetical protein
MQVLGSQGYSISKSAGVCAATGRALQVGERFMATLVEVRGEAEMRRLDFCEDAWAGGSRPTVGTIFAAWRATVAPPSVKKHALISEDEMLDLFEQLGAATERKQMVFRSLLALALVRKRVLRYEGSSGGMMRVRIRTLVGQPEMPIVEVCEPDLNDQEIQDAMEQLGRIIPMDDAGTVA